MAMNQQRPDVDAGFEFKPASALVNGFLAASLILTPGLQVLNNPFLSSGGDAYAQGATSRKSTRGAPSTDANKDPESVLRLALPIPDGNPIREAQASLEMSFDKALREIRNEKWQKCASLNRKAYSIVTQKKNDILKNVPEARRTAASDLLDEISKDLGDLGTTIEKKDQPKIERDKTLALRKIGLVEEMMIEEFPYSIPKEYANLPQLKGRAVVKMTIKKADPSNKFDVDGKIYDQADFTLVVDGFTAPVTGGNFVELVNNGFYNGMKVQRSDGFVIQTGDPNPDDEDKPHGVKNADGSPRELPLEVFALEDKKPTYEVTLEDDGRPLSQPKLPFSVYGTLGMARSEDNANDASSQWFFLLFDPELTTAGRNLMDGRFSTFGYVVEGNRLLSNIEVGDVITDAKVVSGLNYLQSPAKK